MLLMMRLALRNLFRQKRRNFLLGSAMALGMALLMIASAFSHGISDVLFNRIMTYVTGHVSINFTKDGNPMRQYFANGPSIQALVKKTLPNILSQEQGIGIFARAIGESRSDNVILIALNVQAQTTPEQKADLMSNFRVVEGRFEDLESATVENPVIIARQKAEYLRLHVGDVMRVRFQDILGRQQAVRLTVAGIFEPANVFMAAPVFLALKDLRKIAGFREQDVGQIYIQLANPKRDAVRFADSLHGVLQPPLAVVNGKVKKVLNSGDDEIKNPSNGKSHTVEIPALGLGFKVDSASLAALSQLIGPGVRGKEDSLRKTIRKTDILIAAALAESLQVSPGSKVRLSYQNRGDSQITTQEFTLTGILPTNIGLAKWPENILWINDQDFYRMYYAAWPEGTMSPNDPLLSHFKMQDTASALGRLLNHEWVLFDRTSTTKDLEKKYRDITRLKTKAFTVDVQTMYETASMIINLEYALNLITLSAVLILFFIIQVGVVNTLRMTIRERTREIGTMRAIGLQRTDVRNLFLLETFFLSASACIVGVGLAFLAMALLKIPTFQLEGNPLGMLMVNGHFHFKPTFAASALFMGLIPGIAVGTAYFPSRRAARLTAAEALRHYG